MLSYKSLIAATQSLLLLNAKWVSASVGSDVVLMSTVDSSNNHLVNIMQPAERHGNATVEKVGSTSTLGEMDYIEQMLNAASSTSLDSQGGMVSDGKHIVVVANTFNDTISLMTLDDNMALVTRDIVNSGGSRPCSIALQNNIVCALNCGGEISFESSVQCFNMTSDFHLNPISEMSATVIRDPFGAPHPYGETPSEIQFGLDGTTLIVASKDVGWQTYKITENSSLTPVTYLDVLRNGGGAIKCFSQVGNGFIVSAAVTGPGSNRMPADLATYRLNPETGELSERVSVIQSQFTNACWTDYRNGYLYVISPASGTSHVESYLVNDDGSLELLHTISLAPVADMDGRLALDAKLSIDGKYLYVSEQYVSNQREWQSSIRRQPLVPIEERVTPIGYSYVNTIAVGDNGMITLESIDSGRYPLAVTGLTTLSP